MNARVNKTGDFGIIPIILHKLSLSSWYRPVLYFLLIRFNWRLNKTKHQTNNNLISNVLFALKSDQNANVWYGPHATWSCTFYESYAIELMGNKSACCVWVILGYVGDSALGNNVERLENNFPNLACVTHYKPVFSHFLCNKKVKIRIKQIVQITNISSRIITTT